ncbi:gamma-glutamyltransferase [Paenibacillus radicis (ex Xue et al. 2023)]|uniref:Glutathione hydrolase proenzyme n=1 Tax=Paenibacillus radicis (ex Xue et al. 2023) TaxID=2972489 RepID=A0ABT1YR57_9BACL|nr:gamma-glutamyltransferase [Paenibacillus radicis (ex Xue et al. 2023)]MCR8635663.1 gamma-glutamyltransferase [Paenibacillus radicis (ex Xue et al. 2023)]
MNAKNKGSYGVSAAHPLATDAGISILEQGGNAIDAAVAVSFALGVVEPYGSGIGGGGATLLQHESMGTPRFFDYREVLPASGIVSPKEIGVSGFVKGMEEMHRKLGSLPWNVLLQPAIQLAEKGFIISEIMEHQLTTVAYLNRSALPHFFPEGEPLKAGSLLIQLELADTLQHIAAQGSRYFYEGAVAEEIVRLVEGMSLTDLQEYKVLERTPVYGQFAGHDIIGSPAPLAGITIIQALQMAEYLKVSQYKERSAEFVHLIADIIKACFDDRKLIMGDPGFVPIHSEEMTSPTYSINLARKLNPYRLSDAPVEVPKDYNSTTHFVVVDKQGMIASVTNTVSDFFGSGVYLRGFFLNNQMRNFASDPTSPNKAEPGKRPHSYVSPTLIFKQGKPFFTLGSSGGNRVPTILTRLLVRFLQNKMSLEEAVRLPRFYSDERLIYLEEDLEETERNKLLQMGYRLQHHPVPIRFGGIHGMVLGEQGAMYGIADPRRKGKCTINQ